MKSTRAKSSDKDKLMDVSKTSPFGLWTSENLTDESLQCIKEWLMSSAQDSLASHSQSPESKQEKTTHVICGLKQYDPYALLDPDTASWRTCQVSYLTNTLELFSETFPKQGMMHDGKLYRQPKLEGRISEIGCGLWPTPQNRDFRTGEGHRWENPEERSRNLNDSVAHSEGYKVWPTPKRPSGGGQIERTTPGGGIRKLEDAISQEVGYNTGQLNPDWVEWLIGWPIGWTSLEPLPEGNFKDWLEMTLDGTWWKVDPADSNTTPRVATGVKNRVPRLKSIGNGQVSLCAAISWNVLS